MGRGKPLTDIEKGQIIAYNNEKKSILWISNKIKRSRKVIYNFLADPNNYNTKKVVVDPRY